MAIAPGQNVGNYRVSSRLGVGGMGVVYLAEHPVIGKKVALKVIHRELSANREVIGRFYQEARAVNLIGNQHIVEVHDFGQTPEGDLFFVMEYIEGKTLAQVLTRERLLDVPRALHVSAQVAEALQATHAAGIIHRDLKPDNVMLCERGGDANFVKLLDFGLAKVMADGDAKKLTAAGVILGTPQYMSPEACESKKVDHRADIYALGVLMFQMLTGQVPFDADTMGAVLIKQVTQQPPAPRGLSPLIPPAVEQIILRCLAKAPDQRFQTMAELQAALVDPAHYLQGAPAPMRAAQPSPQAQAATMFAVETNAAMGYAATAGMPAYSTKALGLAGSAAVATAATGSHPVQAPTRTTAPGPVQATMLAPAPAAPAHGGQAATMIGVMAAVTAPPAPAAAPAELAPRRVTAAPIAVPQNQTLVIATPPGHTRKPPARRGPLLIALGAVVVVGGVVAALVLAGGGGDSASTSDAGAAVVASGDAEATGPAAGTAAGTATGTAAGTAAGTGAGSAVAMAADAGATPIDAAAPPATAQVTITSDPSGAEVFDASGASLGTTPVTVTAPVSTAPWTLTFKRAGSKSRDKQITVSGDMSIQVLLEPERTPRRGTRPKPPGPGPDTHSDKIDLMEPTYH